MIDSIRSEVQQIARCLCQDKKELSQIIQIRLMKVKFTVVDHQTMKKICQCLVIVAKQAMKPIMYHLPS